jgi:hypothetical protein
MQNLCDLFLPITSSLLSIWLSAIVRTPVQPPAMYRQSMHGSGSFHESTPLHDGIVRQYRRGFAGVFPFPAVARLGYSPGEGGGASPVVGRDRQSFFSETGANGGRSGPTAVFMVTDERANRCEDGFGFAGLRPRFLWDRTMPSSESRMVFVAGAV